MNPVLRENSAHDSTLGCKNGVILPKGCVNTRNTADAVAARVMRLDHPDFACSINSVVAVPPQWTETHSLIRYPSPYGRSCTLRYRPPFFRRGERPRRPESCDRRGIAHPLGGQTIGFDLTAGMALNRVITKEKQTRGFIRCNANPNSYYASRLSWALLPAAIRLASRPLSARGPVPVRRRLSAAVSRPALLSARRVTSPIARASQTAANAFSRALTSATNRTRTIGTPGRAGGFFVVTSARSDVRPMNERGDEICSRKS